MVQNGPISTLWWILALSSTQENLCIFGCFGVKCNEDEKKRLFKEILLWPNVKYFIVIG